MSSTSSQVWNGHQWVSNTAAPSAASTIYKHGKSHAQLVQHYTNYFHLWNAQAEKASSTVTANPNNTEALQRAKWAGYYATNSAALSHYHLGISKGGAVPYERPQSPPPPPGAGLIGANAATETAGQVSPQELRGCTTANNNKRKLRKRGARDRSAAREAREAAEREEREREAREAAEREERGRVQREAAAREERGRIRREAAVREERVRIRRETLRAERDEREAAAAQQNAATRISSLEATLEKRMVEEAKDIKDMEAMLRKKKRSFFESMQSMPPETQSRITLDNDTITASNENDSNQNTCVVCHDEVPIMAVVPCGHLCLCNRCSDVCMSGQSGQRTCPICRGNMQSVLRIYSGN